MKFSLNELFLYFSEIKRFVEHFEATTYYKFDICVNVHL